MHLFVTWVIDRFSLSSAPFAQHLLSSLLPHFPSFPYPLSAGRSSRDNTKKRLPHSCNSNIRVYKYTPSQHFGPHYDDSVKDVGTGARSEWTLLIYLTGIEDGVQGGEVRVYGCVCWHPHYNTCTDRLLQRSEKNPTGVDRRSPHPRHCFAPSVRVPMLTLLSSTDILGSHGYECLLHEGSPVQNGTKYVLRSDLMFLE